MRRSSCGEAAARFRLSRLQPRGGHGARSQQERRSRASSSRSNRGKESRSTQQAQAREGVEVRGLNRYSGPMSCPGKYRFRTWLRGHLPYALLGLAPKGRRDCGDHEWHRADDSTDHCYHCEVGVRPHEPLPPPPAEFIELLERSAANGSHAAANALRRVRAPEGSPTT